jgi:hypothetical protein
VDVTFSLYMRKPFFVEAIEITEENIRDVAKLLGLYVERPDGSKYIQVRKEMAPNVFQGRIYPGYFLTKLNDDYRCYQPKSFHNQFEEDDGTLETV